MYHVSQERIVIVEYINKIRDL